MVGHFDDQGKHYSGMTYPELMQVHHFGIDVPVRQVLTFVADHVGTYKKSYFSKVEGLFAKPYTKKAVKELLGDVGEAIKRTEQNIIGSTPPLVPLSKETLRIRASQGRGTENTPLEDTGELKENVEVRFKK